MIRILNQSNLKKKKVNLYRTGVITLVSLLTSLFVFDAVYNNQLGFPASERQKVNFTISKGEATNSIIERLEKEGLIKNGFFYYLYLIRSGLGNKIQAGEFILNKADDAKTLTQKLMVGSDERRITIIEGWRVEEIGGYLEKEGFNFTSVEFIKEAKSLEGQLFPDTYFVVKDATTSQIISRMNEEFKEKFQPLKGKGGQLNDLEVVILASIVEREARGQADKRVIAGILKNRLKIGMALETDANVQYALGNTVDKSVWWPPVTAEQTKSIQSPYNTYLHPGLPPGPISNPSLDSLEAVISPTASNYYYYLHGRDGQARYAQTVEEHVQNQKKYL